MGQCCETAADRRSAMFARRGRTGGTRLRGDALVIGVTVRGIVDDVVPAAEATFWATGLNGSNRLVALATVLEDRILTVRRQETIENAPPDESVSCLRFEIVER